MDHVCKQEKEIGEMISILRNIVKQVYGNGQEGLTTTVPRLQGSIETLTSTVAAQTVVISDLVKFQTSLTAVDHYKKEDALSSRQRAGIIISGILGFCAIVTSIILKLL